MTMMLLLVGGAVAVWLFTMGGMGQVQGMLSGLGSSLGIGGGGGGGNASASDSGGSNITSGNAGSGLTGVGNNTKIQRNINTSGSPGVTQTSNITQSHRIVQQNGKTLFESNLGRMSYN